jgi:hypothetical protein
MDTHSMRAAQRLSMNVLLPIRCPYRTAARRPNPGHTYHR